MRVTIDGTRLVCAVALSALGVIGACVAPGCASGPGAGEGSVARGPAPSFDEVAAKYNARVAGLDTLWARTTVHYWGFDADDKKVDEAGEGYLQIVRPRKLYFSVGKVGETGFQLGSNDAMYWWIDVQKKVASVGEQARATPDTLARSGVPVHPMDLIEVLGVTELVRAPGVKAPQWTADGKRLQVTVPGRWGGTRVLFLEPERFEPVEIQLLDAGGKLVARAELSDYKKVETPKERALVPRVATTLMISVPSRRSEIRLTLFDAENRGVARIKESSFVLDSRLKEYGVERVRDLDAPVAGVPGAAR